MPGGPLVIETSSQLWGIVEGTNVVVRHKLRNGDADGEGIVLLVKLQVSPDTELSQWYCFPGLLTA